MKFKPHKYQAEAIKEVMAKSSVGLFLDMGLGKTAITLTAIADLIALEEVKRVLVIAPLKTAQNTWGTEVEKWDHLSGLRVSLILGTPKKRLSALDAEADIYVINRENVVWLCELDRKWDFDMVVIDELSSFKNPSAKRFKALRKMMPFANRVVGLTGTPAPNGYMDLWSEIYLLDRGARLGRTVGSYRQTYFHPVRMNGHVVYEWGLNKGAQEMIDKSLSDICMSISAEDALPDLPDSVTTNMYVQMDSSERKLYDRFGKDRVLPEIDVVGLQAASVRGKLLQMANGFVYDEDKKAHFIHHHKIDALRELVEAANGRPVMVFYSFVEDRLRILHEFPEAVELKGDKEYKDWNAGKIPMLVTHPASAGHGLNLQDGGNILIWYGLPDSLELYQQGNKRLHRQGQKKTVYIYHILTKDTYDEDIPVALMKKEQVQDSLLQALKARIMQWET